MLTITNGDSATGSTKSRRDFPVFLYLNESAAAKGDLKVDIDVAFNSVMFDRPTGGQWYFASTGADVEFSVLDGKIVGHRSEKWIDVEYEIESKLETKKSAEFKPSVKVEEKTEFSFGGFGIKKTSGSEGKSSFKDRERLTGSVKLGDDTVRWQITLNRGKKISRDFIYCNFKLWAKCRWKSGNGATKSERRGTARVFPELAFFDSEKRKMSAVLSLLARFVAYRQNIPLNDREASEVQFAYSEE